MVRSKSPKVWPLNECQWQVIIAVNHGIAGVVGDHPDKIRQEQETSICRNRRARSSKGHRNTEGKRNP